MQMIKRRKAHGSFLVCLLLALVLLVLAVAYALYVNVTDAEVFKTALNKADINELLTMMLGDDGVPTSLGAGLKLLEGQNIKAGDLLSGFAENTIAYLLDETQEWKPVITVLGTEFPIPLSEDFNAHMETVKTFVKLGRTGFMVLLGVAGFLLLWVLLTSRKGRSGFSPVGYYIGALLPVFFVIAVIGWAYFDFEGFWAFLHEHFIRDGIFAEGEMIMQVFTTDMFKAFMFPIVKTFAMLLCGILALPVVVAPFCNLIKGSPKS